MKKSLFSTQKQHFSIRKYSFGVASVLIGSTLLFGSSVVSADDMEYSEHSQPVLTPSSETSDSDVDSQEDEALISSDIGLEEAKDTTGTITENAIAEEDVVPELPSSGTYHFDSWIPVKNEPNLSAPTEFYFDKGYSVHYDKTLVSEGHQWLSYISYNGMRRYADLGKVNTTPTPSQPKPEAALLGTITITNKTSQGFDVVVSDVRSPEAILEVQVPIWSSKDEQDDLIWYRAQKTSDGTYKTKVDIKHHKNTSGEYHVHLYYALASGKQVIVSGTKTEVPTEKVQEKTAITKLPSSGTYYFEGEIPVKNEPRLSAPTEFYFDKGYSVNYDKTLVSEGHQWLSYISYNGMRRYADLGKVNATPTPSQPKPEAALSGRITITNKTSQGFDVVISDVKSPEAILEVQVPVWSTKDDQDDLIWYRAQKASDGTYKTKVDIKHHKNTSGEYYVHLYYALASGKQVIVSGTKTEVPQAKTDFVAGDISVVNPSNQGFDVLITGLQSSKGISEVLVPVWSGQAGQDDLKWYKATKESNGDYRVSVKLKDHKDNQGVYHIHLYYRQNDGSLAVVSGTSTVISPKTDKLDKDIRFNGSYYSIQGKYEEILLVNKRYPLSPNYNPGENPQAKAAFLRLRDDMIAQGYNVGYTYSGFRSYDYQATLYQNYANRDGQANADRYSARPGHSEHQTGLAYDLTDRLGHLLEDPQASRWLRHNAHRYGFVVRYLPNKEHITGFMPETWHIRYIGQEANEVYASGLSLEEYFGFEGGDYGQGQRPSVSNTTAGKLAPRGSYTFTKSAPVKAEPKIFSPDLAVYQAGQSVNYDSVVTQEGRQWLSYISYSGHRRYVPIG